MGEGDLEYFYPKLEGGDSVGRPPSPPDSPPRSPHNSHSDSNTLGNNSHESHSFETSPNPNQPILSQNNIENKTWMAQDTLTIPRDAHPLPRHPEKILPKFEPEKKELVEDHIHKFMLALGLKNVDHENIFRIFPFTFEGKATTWYFSLNHGSIHNWTFFEVAFLGKFGVDKTLAKLVLELSRIKMDSNKKVKDFNQCFLSFRNRILENSRPTNDVTTKLYMSTLPPSMAMFVK